MVHALLNKNWTFAEGASDLACPTALDRLAEYRKAHSDRATVVASEFPFAIIDG